MNFTAIAIVGPEEAEIIEQEAPDALAPNEVRGQTLYTLISPGTELASCYQGTRHPCFPGYAAVFRVDEVGADVTDIQPGEHAFCMGRHQSLQWRAREDVVPVPAGLAPEIAVLTRLMGVTMTTLITTSARPGDRVIVTGAGPVGYLGSQIFRAAGYEVHVVDPVPARQSAVRASGIENVYERVPVEDPALARTFALALECSGHEQAVLDAARVVRKGGEVALVGVPWARRADLYVHELLREIFFHYVTVRSGWEWEIPHHAADFRPHSIFGDYVTALRWLKQGKIYTEGLIRIHDPRHAQTVYEDLVRQRADGLFQLFEWNAS